jgi:hypothetical protein
MRSVKDVRGSEPVRTRSLTRNERLLKIGSLRSSHLLASFLIHDVTSETFLKVIASWSNKVQSLFQDRDQQLVTGCLETCAHNNMQSIAIYKAQAVKYGG